MMVVSILVSVGISFFLGSFKDLELIEILVSSFVSSLIFLIIYSVQIPIILKYGAEKGRYVMMGMFLILLLVGTAILKLSWFDKIFQFIDGNIIVVGVVFVMISAVFFLASYCLSLKIYRKKEF